MFGNATMEIVISVDGFPVMYTPARTIAGGIHLGVSGGAYNVCHALSRLANPVTLCITVGADIVSADSRGHVAAPTGGGPITVVKTPVPAQPITAVLLAVDGQRLILNDFRTPDQPRQRASQVAHLMREADLVVRSGGRAAVQAPVHPRRRVAEHRVARVLVLHQGESPPRVRVKIKTVLGHAPKPTRRAP